MSRSRHSRYETLFRKYVTPGEPFDIASERWTADYPDPETSSTRCSKAAPSVPTFEDPAVPRKLAAAARLTGPQRYLTYGQLDLDLARNAAPWIAFGNPTRHEFFSARIGCQTYGVYGIDLAALCIRDTTR